jgi:hypothetical protein
MLENYNSRLGAYIPARSCTFQQQYEGTCSMTGNGRNLSAMPPCGLLHALPAIVVCGSLHYILSCIRNMRCETVVGTELSMNAYKSECYIWLASL